MKLRVKPWWVSTVALVAAFWLLGVWLVSKATCTSQESPSARAAPETSSSRLAPAPASRPQRLLYMTASYSLDQYLFMWNSLGSLVSICDAGWEVEIHLQVASGLLPDSDQFRALQSSLFCARTQSLLPIHITSYNKIGFGLTTQHRNITQSLLDQFDYFVYAEEDMIFTLNHLLAYLSASQRIRSLFSNPLRYTIGFLRYEDSSPVGDRVTWEYRPHMIHLATARANNSRMDELFIVTNNVNQAINIFPREQLVDLQNRCEFLTKPGLNLFYRELRRALNKEWKYLSVGVSEWSSSFQHVLQCGVRRVIPLSGYQQFFIKHDSGKGHKRRPRAELLHFANWSRLLDGLAMNASRLRSVEEIYNQEIYYQYNLHLMNHSRFEGRIRYQWAWQVS